MSEKNTLNPGVEDSLKAMAAENSTPSTSVALQEMQTELEQPIPQAPDAPPVITQKDTIRVMKEITRAMGRFFESLKAVDRQFADYASEFYKNANKLAEKEYTTKEEDTELLINLAIGGFIQTVGKMWNTISTTQQLSQIKTILQKEAKEKLDYVRELLSFMELTVQPAYDRYYEATSTDNLLVCISNIRDIEYNVGLAHFLVTTYEAALQREFQDTIPFPTLSLINRHLLYSLLGQKRELVKDNDIEGRRKCIRSLISAAKRDITSNRTPDREEYVFVADPQIMATAIYDYYPEDGHKHSVDWNDYQQHILSSERYYNDFLSLIQEAARNEHTTVSSALLHNSTVNLFADQFPDIAIARNEYDNHQGYMNLIVLLSIVLGFLASWEHFDIAWYWCIVLGFIAGGVVWWLLPWTSLDEKLEDKLMRIEKTIQKTNMRNSGEEKVVDLAQVEKSNNSRWGFAIIGAIIGFCFAGVGAIPGAIIGFWLGGYEPDEEEDYSYDHIKLTTSLRTWFLLIALGAGILYYLYLLIFT